MMRKIIENTKRHPFKEYKGFVVQRSQENLNTRPSMIKVNDESLFSCKEFKVIFMEQYNRQLGRLDHLWYWWTYFANCSFMAYYLRTT